MRNYMHFSSTGGAIFFMIVWTVMIVPAINRDRLFFLTRYLFAGLLAFATNLTLFSSVVFNRIDSRVHFLGHRQFHRAKDCNISRQDYG